MNVTCASLAAATHCFIVVRDFAGEMKQGEKQKRSIVGREKVGLTESLSSVCVGGVLLLTSHLIPLGSAANHRRGVLRAERCDSGKQFGVLEREVGDHWPTDSESSCRIHYSVSSRKWNPFQKVQEKRLI